ncbi:protein ENHANCED DISEASE RESISTANCE 2 [Salvia miltiorrhiza]|uniref:protein ENHANCED DISEASE RESISTANCE 2 n=1 Tax=Salvia miltiorrhiza TaxID=226208 RepID=UPI0025ABFE2C|nr:protein ENHANCED DISEASE RESISTANCE 2 [Salvia miltiorrhiza]XP_057777949.1 protein ENHANCED DISEASE RESISTANCE 2 [Salvia miltiorrhiza]
MAMLEQKQEREWIERVRLGGGVPLLKPDSWSNGWASPRGDAFMVRGANYPTTKKKVPGGEYLLEPLGFDWIKGPAKIAEVLYNPKGRVRRALDGERAKGRSHFVWAFNFQLPTKDNHSIIAYFVATEPSHQDPLIRRFLNGDDGFRDSRLKLITNVAKGPWVVKKGIGEQAISIIGRALKCRYSMGEKLMQVDIDVGSSMAATAIVHLAFGYLTTLTVELAFVIEGRTESELPERILGAVRFSGLDGARALQIESPSQGNPQSSLGQGISHLVHANVVTDHHTTTKDVEKTHYAGNSNERDSKLLNLSL